MRPIQLGELVVRFGGELLGDPHKTVVQVATLERAGPDEVSFLANSKYARQLAGTAAGAVILPLSAREAFSGNRIVSEEPYAYFARVARLLNPATICKPGIHPTAVVESEVPDSAEIGPHCHIGKDVRLGDRCRIGSGSSIGAGAAVGAESVIFPNVSIYARSIIGCRAIIHSGAVIGADGFGFAHERDGSWGKIPQIGRVVIGDDVEIGAGTTIDRGALDDTVIESGVKLDNQIQIGHNVRIGAHSAMAGCVGVAGSTRIGKRCTVGGAAAILGHLTLADDVHITAGAVIAKSISRAGTYSGSVPVLPHSDWLKNYAHLRRLDALADRIRALERRLAELETRP